METLRLLRILAHYLVVSVLRDVKHGMWDQVFGRVSEAEGERSGTLRTNLTY